MTARVDRRSPDELVRMVARVPGDTRKGEVARYSRICADAGDMMLVVGFTDRYGPAR